jgi:pyruvate, water dikinase
MAKTLKRPAVRMLDDVGLVDVDTVGGKAAALGALRAAGLRVPPGFVVPAHAYLAALDDAGVRSRVQSLFDGALSAVGDPDALADAAGVIRSVVRSVGVPEALAAEITDAYEHLGDDVPVAVRSSALGEDAAGASFAGMHDTFLGVAGPQTVLDRVADCWASLFGARAIAYRAERGITGEPAIAVVVQTGVAPRRAGVAFTADPRTSSPDVVVVEAVTGLGEVLVGGQVEPDTYVVDRRSLSPVQVHIGHQGFAVGGEHVVAGRRQLTDDEVAAVARLALEAETVMGGAPQDVEWVLDEAGVALVQSRPITTLATAALRGVGASGGRATGRVRVLRDPSEAGRLLEGEILVAPMTTPDWLPALRRAGAVVTEGGGVTCHAAIVSRELGVPCVVGARGATTALTDGALVTVDGDEGTVVAGAVRAAPPTVGPGRERAPAAEALNGSRAPNEALGTKVLLNVAMVDGVEEAARLPVDGVGLLRAEFLLTEALGGDHPRTVLDRGGSEEFVERTATSLLRITRAFAPRPVVYRTIDFRTNEFRGLHGGDRFEPFEANPMIGYRGCFRYVREPDLFRLELEAVARVREVTPSLQVMIPFVRTPWELESCLHVMASSALGGQRGLRTWVMAEVPSVVHHLPTYASLGIDGVSIGSNDLTQLMLGVDRDSETCAALFDESDPAVLDAISRIVTGCRELGLTSSICGQAPSRQPAYVDLLVRLGIDSVSVTADAVTAVRREIGAAEQRLLLGAARRSVG